MIEIKEILNPVHLPTVDEWMQIAETSNGMKGNLTEEVAIELMKRFEEITRGKWVHPLDANKELLEEFSKDVKKWDKQYYEHGKVWQPALLLKEHFVCEIKKPSFTDDYYVSDEGYKHPHTGTLMEDDLIKYKEAQAKVIFEGFEEIDDTYFQNGDYLDIYFHEEISVEMVGNKGFICLPKNATIFDLIIEIVSYNRTSKEPIKINLTDSFINQLLK